MNNKNMFDDALEAIKEVGWVFGMVALVITSPVWVIPYLIYKRNSTAVRVGFFIAAIVLSLTVKEAFDLKGWINFFDGLALGMLSQLAAYKVVERVRK